MSTNINIDVLRYATDFYTVDTSQYIVSDCNTITFINYGTPVVTIENVPLQQNQSLSISGNQGEITNQKFFVYFFYLSMCLNLIYFVVVFNNYTLISKALS